MNPILILMTFVAFLLTMGLRYGTQALVTTLLGDGGPASQQRLSLNPFRHLNVLGTCVALALSFPIGAYIPAGLGWGKAIKPDAQRLSIGASSGLIVVALSGILVNLIVGIVIGVGLGFLPLTNLDAQHIANCTLLQGGPLQACLQTWQPGWALRLEQFAFIFASVNIIVGLLNLIPLAPLDGSKILFVLLPDRAAINYRNSETTQELILFAILIFVPFLLTLGGFPPYLSPTYLLQSLSLKILALFSNSNALFEFLAENL
jgi:Zn-dependent protease